MTDIIKLAHGDGGKHMHMLIEEVFYKHFSNDLLAQGFDSAVFPVEQGRLAFTTDSFVVKPIFFPGGDIGKLAACGTINDLAVSGAKPLYLSAGFIIEEGFSIESLESIAESMASVCRNSGVKIVTGDTKVVEKGSVDGIYINTSGIGMLHNNYCVKQIEADDQVIVTGAIGEHGTVIALERYNIKVKGDFKSDCAPLHHIVAALKEYHPFIKMMKDPTRGGLASTLNEITQFSKLGMHIYEEKIPLRKEVRAVNDLLGLDPLYMACEGRMVLAVKEQAAESILMEIQKIEGCKGASIIGSFTEGNHQTVYVENSFGGKRMLNMLEGEMLPRIC